MRKMENGGCVKFSGRFCVKMGDLAKNPTPAEFIGLPVAALIGA